jgi:dipeptidyl aminopeptidase/acylaminoacyl peptidase
MGDSEITMYEDVRMGHSLSTKHRLRHLLLLLLSVVVASAAIGCRGNARRARVSAAPRPVAPPPRENDRGVIGGPRDETKFEFDPEPGEPEKPLLLDGTAQAPEDIRERLAPYLESRRTRLAGALPRQRSFLAVTRLGRSPQVYSVDVPLGPLRRLTDEPEPIEQVSYFGADSPSLLLRTDTGGNERYQLVRLGLQDSQRALLSDGVSRHGAFSIAPGGDTVAFTGNRRSEADMDIYLSDGRTRESMRLLLARQGQWIAGAWSTDGRRMVLREYLSTEHSALHLLDVASGEITPVAPSAHPAVFRDGRFSADDKKFYFSSDRDGDFIQLYELEVASGELRSLTKDIPWDVESMALWSNLIAFTANEDGISVLRIYDTSTRKTRKVRGVPPGIISSFRFADGGKLIALTLDRPTEPGDIYTVEIETGKLERWTTSHVGGDPRRYITPTVVRVPSFDGLDVPAYYYRPRGKGPFPVLLWMHGGPEDQYRPYFDPIIQYFAVERGIAVIAPNVRGSDGYGRRYRSLDNGSLRLDSVRDVGSILDWIADRRELDSTRAGIYGVSYGGYMVLASLVEYGDRLAAGCDVVGLSSLVSFLEGTGAYRRDARRAEYGDERDETMREFLHSISPLTNAARIRSPLFVAHGANDPRVPLGEAQQIVKAVREGGNEAWYMMAPDEGHGFRKRQTRDTFYHLMATFFEKHLLDRELLPDSPTATTGDQPAGAVAPSVPATSGQPAPEAPEPSQAQPPAEKPGEATDQGEADQGEADQGEADQGEASDKGEADQGEASDKGEADQGEVDQGEASDKGEAADRGEAGDRGESTDQSPAPSGADTEPAPPAN